jgi:hypothetical protein
VGSPTEDDERLVTKKKTPRAFPQAGGRVQVFMSSVEKILYKIIAAGKCFF